MSDSRRIAPSETSRALGALEGQMRGMVEQMDLVLDVLREIKQDNRDHRLLDQQYYDKVNELDGNQKKIMGIAAGIAVMATGGIEGAKMLWKQIAGG